MGDSVVDGLNGQRLLDGFIADGNSDHVRRKRRFRSRGLRRFGQKLASKMPTRLRMSSAYYETAAFKRWGHQLIRGECFSNIEQPNGAAGTFAARPDVPGARLVGSTTMLSPRKKRVTAWEDTDYGGGALQSRFT